MMLAKIASITAAAALALALQPSTGWCTRALGTALNGQVTAASVNGVIQIAGRTYRIPPKSDAEKQASTIAAGQNVDVVVEDVPGSTEPVVISITPHTGS